MSQAGGNDYYGQGRYPRRSSASYGGFQGQQASSRPRRRSRRQTASSQQNDYGQQAGDEHVNGYHQQDVSGQQSGHHQVNGYDNQHDYSQQLAYNETNDFIHQNDYIQQYGYDPQQGHRSQGASPRSAQRSNQPHYSEYGADGFAQASFAAVMQGGRRNLEGRYAGYPLEYGQEGYNPYNEPHFGGSEGWAQQELESSTQGQEQQVSQRRERRGAVADGGYNFVRESGR